VTIPKLKFIWGYRGHNSGLWERGPNWRQLTVPASRKRWRCALIIRWPTTPNESTPHHG